MTTLGSTGRHVRRGIRPIAAGVLAAATAAGTAVADLEARLARDVRPLVARFCHECHAGDAVEGDVDLSASASLADIRGRIATWQRVRDVIRDGQMPPAGAAQPEAAERAVLEDWLRDVLRAEAEAHAGDPGAVVLRRLDNAEYAHTIRDLTGVDSLDPAREFPTDGAAGEGFSNTGQALVMSPALVTKYLDAAKEIAAHAVLLPDGLRFSASTGRVDWTREHLDRLREFYRRFTTPIEWGMQTVAHGIDLDLGREGGLPVSRYIAATLEDRPALVRGEAAAVARGRGVSERYLARLWAAVSDDDTAASPLLDAVRRGWRAADGSDPDAAGRIVAESIAPWQKALWKFNPVGQIARHLGRTDGPARWMEPVDPLVSIREFRVALEVPSGRESVVVRLVATDAGDGHEQDDVVWLNPRLVAPGVPDVHVSHVRRAAEAVADARAAVAASVRACLGAVAGGEPGRDAASGVDRVVLDAWSSLLGPSDPVPAEGFLLTTPADGVAGHECIAGWTGPGAASVLANTGDDELRLPATFVPHGVVMHPAPDRRVVVAWKCPRPLRLRVEGTLGRAHVGCGNGIAWSLEARRGTTRQTLASGTAEAAGPTAIGPIEGLALRHDDRLCLLVDPRAGDHSCDSTAVDLVIRAGDSSWSLARDLAVAAPGGGIASGNPVPDASGNPGAWELGGEPAGGGGWTIPRGSLLARWQDADPADREPIAAALERLLASPDPGTIDADNRALRALLLATTGPLVPRVAAGRARSVAAEAPAPRPDADHRFGRHPSGRGGVDETDLCVRAPATVAFEIPADLAAGREFVVAAAIHPASAGGAAVQPHVLTDGDDPPRLSPAVPVLTGTAGPARDRFVAAFAEFRELFPPAVCYARVVPVDEVITLNVFYREDDLLRRLLLDDADAARLDRLWDELLFVAQEPYRLRDALEQLIQFATQDRVDLVNVFAEMKPVVDARADAFTRRLEDAETIQLGAVVDLAARAWRRPLSAAESDGLRRLVGDLRRDGLSHEEAVRLAIARVLVAPSFLYKLETPPPGRDPAPVSGRELATRLSYFLWSSLPDRELAAAADGLQEPDVLLAETRRMVRDPRIRRLAEEFGTHWLHVHGFDHHDEKSETAFPEFAALRGAMHEEAVLLLTELFRDDRSIRSLIDSDRTFLNGDLARHYGIDGVTGPEWRPVEGVRRHGRGGVLTLAATLARQSGASRTSPILRGTWFTETLLGERLPKPPKNVPPLAEAPPAGLSERELTALHSSHAACAGCHARFDPYGFALEEFDAIGRRRSHDTAGRAIDAAAVLPDGTRVAGADDLRRYLADARGDAFERQFLRKLLGFALGRGVQLSDEPLLDEIQSALAAGGHRTGIAVEAIVLSPQFRGIRGLEEGGDR